MKPFLTLLLDSFRSLKSGTIFWITLGLSALVALIFLSIGFDDKGISIFFGGASWESEFMAKDSPLAHVSYVMLFSNVVAGIWLTFIAIILALISCSSIFPDAMKEGTAGMLMTKKPSRLQVFLAKLTGSLFFVLVQVGLFVVIVFLAFRWRLGVWNFSVFWYVPAVLLVFLNLYSFMVLVAVKTRSVMTAILLTMLLWGISAALNWAVGLVDTSYQASRYDQQTEEMTGEGDANLKSWSDTLKLVHMPFPKNAPIMAEAEKKLVMDGIKGFGETSGFLDSLESEEERRQMTEKMDEYAEGDSKFYSIGTSCIFAFIMLSLAGWSFCRRDF